VAGGSLEELQTQALMPEKDLLSVFIKLARGDAR
jgi:hypothetical protein